MVTNATLQVPEGWYEPWEVEVKTWKQLTHAVNKISLLNPDRRFLWRGLEDASYSLVSNLHRQLATKKGEKTTYADEAQVSHAEQMVTIASSLPWRLDEADVPKLMAKLQHLGAPTRFLDVTSNALVAAWFACHDDSDDIPSERAGRLFAFGVDPNGGYTFPNSAGSNWPFNKSYADRSNTLTDENAFMHWFPPFDSHIRIFAQNAGFIFGHSVSLDDHGIDKYPKVPFSRTKAQTFWRPEEVQQALGLHVRFQEHGRALGTDWQEASAYIIKISPKAKSEIRALLRRNYGISQATMFPGVEGFAKTLSNLSPGQWVNLLEDTNICFA